jgi:hypothetical protein
LAFISASVPSINWTVAIAAATLEKKPRILLACQEYGYTITEMIAEKVLNKILRTNHNLGISGTLRRKIGRSRRYKEKSCRQAAELQLKKPSSRSQVVVLVREKETPIRHADITRMVPKKKRTAVLSVILSRKR